MSFMRKPRRCVSELVIRVVILVAQSELSNMEQITEIYQPMPDNMIRVHSGRGKRLEVLADYKGEDHFMVRLTNAEAGRLA